MPLLQWAERATWKSAELCHSEFVSFQVFHPTGFLRLTFLWSLTAFSTCLSILQLFQLLVLLTCWQLVIASPVRLLLVEEGIALPDHQKIRIETCTDKVGCCPPILLSVSDSISSVPPCFPLFLIQPYVCVLYM